MFSHAKIKHNYGFSSVEQSFFFFYVAHISFTEEENFGTT